jgi:hypothetical protein
MPETETVNEDKEQQLLLEGIIAIPFSLVGTSILL